MHASSTEDRASLPFHAAVRRWLIARTSLVEIEQHYLIASALSDQCLVMDLGANVGRFSAQVLDRFGCGVVAVEPERTNFDAIPEHGKLLKIQAAVGGTCSHSSIRISSDSTGHRLDLLNVSGAASEQSVAVHDFSSLVALANIQRIDLMKIDVEGSEWDWLDSMSDNQLTAVGQITIEFHDFLPEYRETNRTWANYQRLLALGFHCIEDPRFSSYNVLFVNRRLKLQVFADRVLIPLLDGLLRTIWKFNRLRRRLFQPA